MSTRMTTLLASLSLSGTCVLTAASPLHAQRLDAVATDTDGSSSEGSAVKPERIEWLVATVDASYRALDLNRIEYDGESAFGRLIPATASGPSPGVGLGVKLWFVSLMLHGDVTFLSATSGAIDDDMQLWNVDLEASMRLLQGQLQPYFLIGGGYSALAGVDDLLDGQRREAEGHGANARLGLGLDYYLDDHFTLGFRGTVDGLWLASRVSFLELAQPEQVDTLRETRARLREADGSVAGLGYAAGVTFGAHYP
jgi:hypothetical protein